MLNIPENFTHTVVVGAGPYGLSVAAHLRARGIPFRIFGQPMQTWATQMPQSMRLQSQGLASNLSNPQTPYTLSAFCAETGRPYHDTGYPVPLEDFIAYGQEFTRRFVPTLETENIRSIKRNEAMFRLQTASGEQFFAQHIVLAPGLSLFQHLPAEFRRLPAGRVTHPAQHRTFHEFAGRDVTVLGCGASALNTAAGLHEAGARVTLIARSRKILLNKAEDPAARSWIRRALRPGTPLGNSLRSQIACTAPEAFHLLPAKLRRLLLRNHLGPSGDVALTGRLDGFQMLLGAKVHAVEAADGSGERLRLTFTDADGNARQHLTSHLVSGTGYRIDIHRLGMLCPSLREDIRLDDGGAPRLDRAFESSVPGLHLVGPIAAPSFGPLLRFVAGTGFAAERVSLAIERSVARERRTPARQQVVQALASPARERTL